MTSCGDSCSRLAESGTWTSCRLFFISGIKHMLIPFTAVFLISLNLTETLLNTCNLHVNEYHVDTVKPTYNEELICRS